MHIRYLFLAIGIFAVIAAGCISPSSTGNQPHGGSSSTGALVTYPVPANGSALTCPEAQLKFITDTNVYQTPQAAEPPARVPFRDPVFGTCLVRVTDRATDISADDSSKGLKNEYSRVQSFNADGSRILVRGTDGTWYLYDARSLVRLARLPLGIDPRWDATNPDLVCSFNGPALMSFNTRTLEERVVHDFAPDFPGERLSAVWTRYEGSPSRDGRYWGLMTQDEDYHTVALLVYDQATDAIIARRAMNGVPNADADSVTISPSGRYVVAQNDYCERGGPPGTYEKPCGLMVYDRDLKHARGLLRIVGHSDFAYDAQGREVLVFQNIDDDTISFIDLESGKITPLVPLDFSHTATGLHFSGLAYGRPGWVLVSTHNGGHPIAFTWMDDSVFAMEVKPQGRIVRLAHTHSVVREDSGQDYWAEPQASVNRDFTKVLFTTNWGRAGTDEVEMYMIGLPEDWTSRSLR